MKKLTIFVAALVLALGLAQCKKEQPATPQNTEGNLVHITVNVGNGSRADVDPSTGAFSFRNGDKLYVGYDNACVGTLEYNSSTNKFSGNLNLSQNGNQRLHFYYLGGYGEYVNQVDETQYTVDIYEQYENPYPVISYGTSTEDYSTDEASYSTTLENQCALVEFTTNWIRKDSRIYIEEINNRVIIDFANNTFTPGRYGNEQISLYPETPTSRWAILLPSEEQMTVTVAPVDYDNIGIIIPPVHKNDFLHFSFELTATDADKPLTMMAYEGATISVINPPDGMKYDIGEGKQTINGVSEISIYVSRGNKVRFYGDGTRIKDYSSTNIVSSYNVELSGNIMSLVDEENFATATSMVGASFAGLFAGNTCGFDASGLLLPATTLSENCYSGMFAGCFHMDGGPAELPALTLAPGCYSNMFKGCNQVMWSTPLVLPATELVDSCYFNMFYECGNLEALICLATTINGTDCTKDWIYGVNNSGTFTKAKDASFWDDPDLDLGDYGGIPWGWEVNEY